MVLAEYKFKISSSRMMDKEDDNQRKIVKKSNGILALL